MPKRDPADESRRLTELSLEHLALKLRIKTALNIDETEKQYSMWYLMNRLYDRMTELENELAGH